MEKLKYLSKNGSLAMTTLSDRDRNALELRGITLSKTIHGTEITITLQGFYWLFNYLHSLNKNQASISASFLRSLAAYRPSKGTGRELLFQAYKLSVYEDKNYFLIALYLNGSPPRCFHTLSPRRSISNYLDISTADNSFIKVHNDQIIQIKLHDEEMLKLIDGELIRILPDRPL